MLRAGRWLVLALVVALVAGIARAQPAGAAQATPAPGLALVRATYDGLLDLYYRPLEPATLLTSGWEELTTANSSAGRPAPPPLGVLPPGREEAFDAFAAVYSGYVAQPPTGQTPVATAFTIAEGMTASLDEQHTTFLTPDAYQEFLASLGGSRLPVGLGVRLAPRPPLTIAAVAPGGPADVAGVQPGDVIVAIDGKALRALQIPEIIAALTSTVPGTMVTLGVERASARLDLGVARDSYYFPPLESRMLPDGIGYIKLDQFVAPGLRLQNGTEILSDLDRQLDALDAQGARGLVLDLRGNSGGSTVTAGELLGRFLPEDTRSIVLRDARGRETTELVSGAMRATQLPMAVLIDAGSASASEMTALTLRDARRAALVGTTTAGVLNAANVLSLPEGAGLQVAVAEVLTASGRESVDRTGIDPDVRSEPLNAAEYRNGLDHQLDAAVAALAGAPPPPAVSTTPSRLSRAQIATLLEAYLPLPERVTTGSRGGFTRTATRTINHPNQAFPFGARDPLALQAAIRARGWLGSHSASYGPEQLERPSAGITIELYDTAEGATAALAATDLPELIEEIPAPLQLGDGTRAFRGIWIAQGGYDIAWRRGNVILDVSYADLPGAGSVEALVELARLVDALYAANPLVAGAIISRHGATGTEQAEHQPVTPRGDFVLRIAA